MQIQVAKHLRNRVNLWEGKLQGIFQEVFTASLQDWFRTKTLVITQVTNSRYNENFNYEK